MSSGHGQAFISDLPTHDCYYFLRYTSLSRLASSKTTYFWTSRTRSATELICRPGSLPAGLVTAVLGINLEAVAFSALVNSVWTPKQYHCASLHIHKLNFDPSRVAWACKSCGKSLMHGFKVAFNCKKCDYSCCLACYRHVSSFSTPRHPLPCCETKAA